MAWGKAGSTTLSSAGDDIDITSLSESKTRMIMSHVLNSGACQNKVTFNNTGSSKYACRIQYNDDPEDLRVNQNFIPHWDGNDNASNDQFVVSYLCDVEGEEKLGMYWSIDRGTAGAGNTIRAREVAYKFIDTPKITRFDLNNQGSGDYGADSNVTILGSEITPAAAVPAVDDVQDNSLFVEKDTANRYWFNANPLFTDDFSSDNFTHADSSKTSVSSNKFNWEIELDNSDDTAYQALGLTLDNSSWVMRFKITTDTLATASNPGAYGKFVLASSNAGQSGSFDWIGFERYVSSASNTWNLGYGDGTSGNTATDGFTTAPAASSTYYMELIRNGTSLTGKMYTGSDYSTGLVDTTTLTISGTVQDLSFFKFYNRSDNTNTSQTATGTIEDLKVWNGVTTASGGGEWTID